MNEADLDALVMKLRNTTPLVRLSMSEAKAVVAIILALPEIAALLAAPKAAA